MSSVDLDDELEILEDKNIELKKKTIRLRRLKPQELKQKFLKEQNSIIDQFLTKPVETDHIQIKTDFPKPDSTFVNHTLQPVDNKISEEDINTIKSINEERSDDPVWQEIEALMKKDDIPDVHPSIMEYLHSRNNDGF